MGTLKLIREFLYNFFSSRMNFLLDTTFFYRFFNLAFYSFLPACFTFFSSIFFSLFFHFLAFFKFLFAFFTFPIFFFNRFYSTFSKIFIKWFFSTNHKHIGALYIFFAFLAGIFGTSLSILIFVKSYLLLDIFTLLVIANYIMLLLLLMLLL